MTHTPTSDPTSLAALLQQSAALHRHLCPRQVLGVRMGLYAAELLGLALPQSDKRLFTIVETDGCFADGVSVATGCTLGHRTLRLADYGKVAATFADTQTGQAIRIAPRSGIRQEALHYAPDARNKWQAQLEGYQRMPAAELFAVQTVVLTLSLERLISRPGVRTACEQCGEEIINEREVIVEGRVLCQACAGQGYYQELERAAWIAPTMVSLAGPAG
ncbi:MAG: FmdE family protein [Anaerolineae bacterium]